MVPFGGGGILINSGNIVFNAGNDVKITKMLSGALILWQPRQLPCKT